MTSFAPQVFLERLGQRLTTEFEDAAQAGTPGLIGSAREHPARKQLEYLLPHAASVGTGLIIDSYGGVSRQQDIIVYERGFCPAFSINNTPDATYYPCEGTIAVGEVKSRMGSKELEDAFNKIASVKRLQRRAIATDEGIGPHVSYRRYGSPLSMAGTKGDQFNQKTKRSDQVYGFILCGAFDLKPETFFAKAQELWKRADKSEAPNLIISMNNGIIQPYDSTKNIMVRSPIEASSIAYSTSRGADFGVLIERLNATVLHGRTVDVDHLQYYFQMGDSQNFTIAKVGDI